jgi:hypothetical protein
MALNHHNFHEGIITKKKFTSFKMSPKRRRIYKEILCKLNFAGNGRSFQVELKTIFYLSKE